MGIPTTNPCLDYVLETERIDEEFLAEWRVDYYEHHENPDEHDGNHEQIVERCSICAAEYERFQAGLTVDRITSRKARIRPFPG